MIYSPPKYLILHIARFTKSYYQTEKNKTEVKFDSILNLNLPQEQKGNYKLMGIVNHLGSLNRGHYYANVLI
jgi:ubiquitin C-terminal hydrolase